MGLMAPGHPLSKPRTAIPAPEPLSNELASPAFGIPDGAGHIGFSRSGDLLYWSDNIPSFLWDMNPVNGLDGFFAEMAAWVRPEDSGAFGDFRSRFYADRKTGVLLNVLRRGGTSWDSVILCSRKHGDGFQILLVPGGGGKPNPSALLETAFFSADSPVPAKIDAWLKTLDDDLLANVAARTFRELTRDTTVGGVRIRSVNKPELELLNGGDTESGVPVPPDNPSLMRWWGTVIEEIDQTRNPWIHTVIRCGRVRPVATVSADMRSVREIGLNDFQKILTRMTETVQEASKTYAWSTAYRYVRHWKEPVGYDLETAEDVIEFMMRESKDICVLPVRVSLRNLPQVYYKTRLDEPYFWDEARGQVYILLRNTTVDNAEIVVRPSFESRVMIAADRSMSLETFCLKYCMGVPPEPGF